MLRSLEILKVLLLNIYLNIILTKELFDTSVYIQSKDFPCIEKLAFSVSINCDLTSSIRHGSANCDLFDLYRFFFTLSLVSLRCS